MQYFWDPQKAKINAVKHGVTFEEAATVFFDPLAITYHDVEHSIAEDRFRTYGYSHLNRLLVVIHNEVGNSIRIISARKTTRHEKIIYEKG